MASSSLGHRAPLLWLVFPLAAGLALAKASEMTPPLTVTLGIALLSGVGACIFAVKSPRLWASLLALSMISAGVGSDTLHHPTPPDWSGRPPREAQLQLRVIRVFDSPYPQRASGFATIRSVESPLADLLGQKVFYSLKVRDSQTTPIPTTEFEALGVIESLPTTPAPNSFEDYLVDTGIAFRFGRGQMIAETRPATAFQRFCDRTAERFNTFLKMGVAEKRPELANISSAMLLGRKADLSPRQDELFMHSGTMHLFAISGLHIGVIALALHALLLLTRLPRVWRFVISVIALGLYVAITGSTPSAVRAFTMVALFQTSTLFRLPGNPLSALTASALIVLCVAPAQLFSASFQMSYGIVTAILLLGLPMGEAFKTRLALFSELPGSTWKSWQQVVALFWRAFLTAFAIGLASILFSLLAGVQYFGLLTPGALIANLVLIPAASLVILAGIGSLLCGMLGFTMGTLLCNHAAVLILWGIDEAIRQFVTWPGIFHVASFKTEWLGPCSFTALLAVIFFGYARGWELRLGGWAPPFILVGLILIFGVNFG